MRGGVRHLLRLAECGLCRPDCEDRIDSRCASILAAGSAVAVCLVWFRAVGLYRRVVRNEIARCFQYVKTHGKDTSLHCGNYNRRAGVLFEKRVALSICAERIVCCCASTFVWDLLCLCVSLLAAHRLSLEAVVVKRASAFALVCDHAL